MVHPFCNWRVHKSFLFTWKWHINVWFLLFYTCAFLVFISIQHHFSFCFDFLLPVDTPVPSILDLLVASLCQSHTRRTAHPGVLRGRARGTEHHVLHEAEGSQDHRGVPFVLTGTWAGSQGARRRGSRKLREWQSNSGNLSGCPREECTKKSSSKKDQ